MRPILSLNMLVATALATSALPVSVMAAAAPPATTALPNAPVTEARPAPAFKAGDQVTDAAGMVIGSIKTLTEAEGGPVVVVEIDAKLVGVPQSTLTLANGKVISSQTKAQMLAAAGAPR